MGYEKNRMRLGARGDKGVQTQRKGINQVQGNRLGQLVPKFLDGRI